MGKNKLARWAELETFDNVIQHRNEIGFGTDHPIKGKWRTDFFRNDNPLVIELGCGRGEYTTALAEKYPAKNFVGVDIKGARLWRGAKTAWEEKLKNAAFIRTRIEFINSFFGGDEVDEIWLTFPDPQEEKKNSNKRLTCAWFLNNYRKFMRDKGIIHLKTDNTGLFRYTNTLVLKNSLEIIEATTDLHSGNISSDNLLIRTRYEDMFIRKGSKINYLSFRLEKNRNIEELF